MRSSSESCPVRDGGVSGVEAVGLAQRRRDPQRPASGCHPLLGERTAQAWGETPGRRPGLDGAARPDLERERPPVRDDDEAEAARRCRSPDLDACSTEADLEHGTCLGRQLVKRPVAVRAHVEVDLRDRGDAEPA